MTKIIEVRIPVHNTLKVTIELEDNKYLSNDAIINLAIKDAIKNQEKVTWLIDSDQLDKELLKNWITVISV